MVHRIIEVIAGRVSTCQEDRDKPVLLAPAEEVLVPQAELIESRRAARVAADGDLVLLAHQDRSRWNRALIHEGHVLVRHCLARNEPGPSQLQAAINAVHSCASSAADTDWQQILLLYNQQMAIAPRP